MLWLYWGEFVKLKWVKIWSLAALQVPKVWEQWSNLHEPLNNRTYLGKKLFFFLFVFFNFLKSGHRREKQPVLEAVK